MSFEQVHRVKVGDLEVAFREAGDAQAGGREPIVFVHGWPLSSLTWRKVIPALASAAPARCLALDLLGAGESPLEPERDHGLAAQAELVRGFLDALGLERVTLVGHDSGGSIARDVAVAAPERVSRLVLADTEVPGHKPPFVALLSLAARVPGSRSLLARTFGSQTLARSPAGFGLCFADTGAFDFGEFHAALVAPNARSEAASRCAHKFLLDFDFGEVDALASRYPALTMPKLLIWGDRDRFFPLAQGRRLCEMLPEPRQLEVVPGAGLFVHEEKPEEWIRAVRSFLAQAPGS
ncbi:MAG: alpha/beta fold hydrolase [Myxococcota bacterium]